MNDRLREDLAVIWRERARLSRQSVFGSNDVLLPLQDPVDSATAAPGYVGQHYTPGGLVIVSVNPAGGKDGAISSPADKGLYRSLRALRDSTEQPPLQAFETANALWQQQMPGWTVYRQHTAPILRAAGVTIQEVAYVYVIPFRTRGDVAAKIKSGMIERARPSFREQISALRPGTLISMDRMAEGACNSWAVDAAEPIVHWYYTRKRDAHKERAETLAAIASAP
jgi:hypothetical protein